MISACVLKVVSCIFVYKTIFEHTCWVMEESIILKLATYITQQCMAAIM